MEEKVMEEGEMLWRWWWCWRLSWWSCYMVDRLVFMGVVVVMVLRGPTSLPQLGQGLVDELWCPPQLLAEFLSLLAQLM